MFHLSSCFLDKSNLYRKNSKRIKWNLTYKLRCKIQIYCCMYNLIPKVSCLSDIGRWDLSLSPILERQNALRTRLLYICTYMYTHTQIYNLCDLFMLALQYDLWLVTVQWCSFLFSLFPKDLCWRSWSKEKQINPNGKKKNLGQKRRSQKSSW